MGQIVLSQHRPDGTLVREGALFTNAGGPVVCEGGTFNGRDVFFIGLNSFATRELFQNRGISGTFLVQRPLLAGAHPRLGMCFTGRQFYMLRDRPSGTHTVDRYSVSGLVAHRTQASPVDTTTKTGITLARQSLIMLDAPSTTVSTEEWRDDGINLRLTRTLTGTSTLGQAVTFDGQDLLIARTEAGGTGYRIIRRRRGDAEGLGTIAQNLPAGFKALGDIDWNGRDILVFWTTEDASDNFFSVF